jgi:GNAT superfamily N-acetyltransferase
MPHSPITIRTPHPTDGKIARKLGDLATYGHGDADMLDKLAIIATTGFWHSSTKYDDLQTMDIDQVSTRQTHAIPLLGSMRVADYHGQTVGMSYSIPPMTWVTGHSGLRKIDQIKQLSAAIAELNILAVLPKFRCRGTGALLLADAEKRYAKAGYKVMMVMTATYADAHLIDWYTQRGYTFAQPGEFWTIQYWADRKATAGSYNHIDDIDIVGFKSLAPTVTVTGGRGSAATPTVTGLLD